MFTSNALADGLDQRIATDDIIISFAYRNPPVGQGRGRGRDGVVRRSQILQYAEALEAGFKTLTAAPLELPAPNLAPPGKVPVYVRHLDGCYGFASITNAGYPILALASRGFESSSEEERHRVTPPLSTNSRTS